MGINLRGILKMESKEFRKIFGKVAKSNGFESAFGGWYKESEECIVTLELQKSNFGEYFQLNIKVFVQGFFGQKYLPDKNLIKKSVGHIHIGETQEYKDIFDFDIPMNNEKREEKLTKLFKEYITPLTEKFLQKEGIKDLENRGNILLLPAVKEELHKQEGHS